MEWNREIMQKPMWKEEISNREEKEKIARRMAEKVQDGEVVGFGSGSTSYLTAIEIANKIQKENITITAIPTSYEIKMLCTYLNIPTATIDEKKPDWCFDGADEVDNDKWLIKGRGAAMFNEKLNIKTAAKTYILVDKSKLVNKLGANFPIPKEPPEVPFLSETPEDFVRLVQSVFTSALEPVKPDVLKSLIRSI